MSSDKKESKRAVTLLPLRDIIIFPHMVVPIFVGREKSIKALEEAMNKEKDLILCAQKKAKTNEPTADEIYRVGTLGTIIQLLRLPDNTVKVLIEGKKRAKIENFLETEDFFMVEINEIEELNDITPEVEELMKKIHATFETYVKLSKNIPPEMLMSVASIDDPSRLADTIVAHLKLKLAEKQEILETESSHIRLEKVLAIMEGHIEFLQLDRKIQARVKKQMEKSQKEYYLNEQMQAI
jgi:ATP-dependent Lon protease